MSSKQLDLCVLLLKEYFGEIVANIGQVLGVHGPTPLRLIILKSGESITNIKKALVILIRHQMVTFLFREKSPVEYELNINRVLLIVRYPRYIAIVKKLFGELSSLIISELLKEGILSVNQAVKKLVSEANTKKNVCDTFVNVFKLGLIKAAVAILNKTQEACWCWDSLKEDIKVISHAPKLFLDSNSEEEGIPKKRSKDFTSEVESVYWCVDFNQFHAFQRNSLIIDAFTVYHGDTKAGELLKIFFKISDSSTKLATKTLPKVSKHSIIKAALKEKIFESKEQVETYLSYFVKDVSNRFVIKTEEQAGTVFYSINLFEILEKMIQSCVSSMVNDRFGAKSARIFRLLCLKKLQQKQIEEIAMISAKDAKECTYNLFRDDLVKILQLPKQTDYVPSGTVFLFYVDMEDVCRNMLQRCYQATYNLITRRLHENEENSGLIGRKIFIDTVIANLKMQNQQVDIEKQIEELNQSFSSYDKELLEKLNKFSQQCEVSEMQVDETCFLLQTWLDINVEQC